VIKAVVFDLDDTLYDQSIYYAEVCKQFATENHFDQEELISHFRSLYGKSTDIFGDILKAIGKYSIEKQEAFFRIYASIDTQLDMYSDALDLIKWLKGKKINTGIITNGVLEVQRNKIRALNTGSLFDTIVFARSWGKEMEKPHPKPFIQAMNNLSCDTDNMIYVGDSIQTDINGAMNADIKRVFLLDRNGRINVSTGMKIISTLTEIKNAF
jgi:putative hydrolase of the HAD superfamily